MFSILRERILEIISRKYKLETSLDDSIKTRAGERNLNKMEFIRKHHFLCKKKLIIKHIMESWKGLFPPLSYQSAVK